MADLLPSEKQAAEGAPDPPRAAGPAPLAVIPRRRSWPRRSLWIAGLVAVIGGLWWWWRSGAAGDGVRRYVTVAVDTGDVSEAVTATGTVQAVETVQVGALVSGRVMKLGADENDEVKQGQVLAVIDPEPYQARLEQAQAQLLIAQASLERAKAEKRRAERERDRLAQLGERGAAGLAVVDDAESAVEMARAMEKSALAELSRARASAKASRLDLDRTTIVSPMDGLVLSRVVEEGQSVTAGFQTPTLFTVARDLGEMEVRAAIDEADVGKVKEGQEARFTVDAYPGEDFVGRIAQIRRSPTVTQNVVTFEAIVRVPNPEKRLWPGMTATVRVVTAEQKNVVRVPNVALRFKPPRDMLGDRGGDRGDRGGDRAERRPREGREEKKKPDGPKRPKRRVWKLVDGKPIPVEVELGIADDEFTEIVSGGLAAGDQVVSEIAGGPESGGPSGGRPPIPGARGGGRRRF